MVWVQVVEKGQQKRFEMPQFACPFFFYRLFCTKCNRKSLKKGYWILYNFRILLIRVMNHRLLKGWPLQPLTRYLASRTFLRIFGSLLVGFEKSITMFFCCEDFKDYYWLNYDQKRTRIDWDMTTFRYDGIGLVQDRVALILYDVELTGKKRDKKIMKGSE